MPVPGAYAERVTTAAGIVLAGGRSSRMGTAKASLEWHGSTLLHRVAGLVARATGGPVIVVRAAGQALPRLPAGVEIAEDEHEERGPLEGVATGLAAVVGRAEMAFVASTDAPFLHPAFVRRVLAMLDEDADLAIPDVGGRLHPLAAAYRASLLSLLRAESGARRLRVSALPGLCRARHLDAGALLADERLTALDPDLDSLQNLNTPADYQAARARAAPAVAFDGQPACAATLAMLGVRGRVRINGELTLFDRELPLATGDVVVRA